MNKQNFYEDYSSKPSVKLGSDKNFGLVISVVFLIATYAPLIKDHTPHWWCLVTAFIIYALSYIRPKLLRPLHISWIKFGEFLRTKVTTPIIIFILFFIVFLPIGIILKIFGKDLLNIKKNKQQTNWKTSNGQTSSFLDQF